MLISELGDVPCDFGTPTSKLSNEFPQLNFTELEEVWWKEKETETEVI